MYYVSLLEDTFMDLIMEEDLRELEEYDRTLVDSFIEGNDISLDETFYFTEDDEPDIHFNEDCGGEGKCDKKDDDDDDDDEDDDDDDDDDKIYSEFGCEMREFY